MRSSNVVPASAKNRLHRQAAQNRRPGLASAALPSPPPDRGGAPENGMGLVIQGIGKNGTAPQVRPQFRNQRPFMLRILAHSQERAVYRAQAKIRCNARSDLVMNRHMEATGQVQRMNQRGSAERTTVEHCQAEPLPHDDHPLFNEKVSRPNLIRCLDRSIIACDAFASHLESSNVDGHRGHRDKTSAQSQHLLAAAEKPAADRNFSVVSVCSVCSVAEFMHLLGCGRPPDLGCRKSYGR